MNFVGFDLAFVDRVASVTTTTECDDNIHSLHITGKEAYVICQGESLSSLATMLRMEMGGSSVWIIVAK
ncbi:hypothetical protein TNCV_1040741 [Trichonephila clavipes]|nr:hypothetical protein TNCV_1040741 [Trichonephila clavipes]